MISLLFTQKQYFGPHWFRGGVGSGSNILSVSYPGIAIELKEDFCISVGLRVMFLISIQCPSA
jgi:hypothetical protein